MRRGVAGYAKATGRDRADRAGKIVSEHSDNHIIGGDRMDERGEVDVDVDQGGNQGRRFSAGCKTDDLLNISMLLPRSGICKGTHMLLQYSRLYYLYTVLQRHSRGGSTGS